MKNCETCESAVDHIQEDGTCKECPEDDECAWSETCEVKRDHGDNDCYNCEDYEPLITG